ncbi:MAG: hypothetical protein OXE53_08030 [Deltaproteobacteria bacterium]|nr:hypothetical protein [Deltaproteobacteria bacterium]
MPELDRLEAVDSRRVIPKINSEGLFDCLLTACKSNAPTQLQEIEVNPREGDTRERPRHELGIEATPVEGYQSLRLLEVVAEQVLIRPPHDGPCTTAERPSNHSDLVMVGI